MWYVLVFCANFRCLVWCWVWWLFFASFLFCRAGLLWTLGEGISVKVLSQHFPLQIFLLIWEDENCGPRRENFLPGFPSSPFSLLCQTVENTVFHPIFLPMFSILSIFTPTKHSVKVMVNFRYLRLNASGLKVMPLGILPKISHLWYLKVYLQHYLWI